MFTVIETLGRLMVMITYAFIHAGAAILGGIALISGNSSRILRKFSRRKLKRFNHGKYEAKMRNIAVR